MPPQIGHLLNRQLQHWRETFTPDGGGGQTSAWTQLGTVRARLSQPTSTEEVVAVNDGSKVTHVVHMLPTSPVLRGDELRDPAEGLVLDVHAVYRPSVAVYLRADCESRQSQPG